MSRAQKPTQLKKLEGTFRADRSAKNEMRGEVLTDLPDASRRLDRFSKSVWNGAGEILVSHRLLQDLDLIAFEQFCVLSGLLLKAGNELRKLSEKGTIERKNKKGVVINEVINPKVRLYQQLLQNWLPMAREFGLTPAARSKISMPSNTGQQLTILDYLDNPKKTLNQ